MARHRRLGVAVVLMAVGFGLAGLLRAQSHPPGQHRHPPAQKLKNPVAPTEKSIATGRQLFQKYCRPCHGASGKGDGPLAPEGSKPSDLTDDVWDHGSSDGEIFTVIRDGAAPGSGMEPWGERLSETDIWHLVNYVRSLNPKTTRKPG
jgi:cbb3-type cytochrome c oxidase subunit III